MAKGDRKLILLRHAKSDWNASFSSDFDRPLNDRGRIATPLIGAYAKDKEYKPDLIFCSPARRTRQTCTLFLEATDWDIETRFENPLYGAHTDDIYKLITQCSRDISTLMIIGHNPGLGALAYSLAPEEAHLFGKFPTASFAVFNIESETWQNVGTKTCKLIDFVKPRDLA